MERQSYDVSLTRYPQGWRSTFLRESLELTTGGSEDRGRKGEVS
jgi:hypothetical protein